MEEWEKITTRKKIKFYHTHIPLEQYCNSMHIAELSWYRKMCKCSGRSLHLVHKTTYVCGKQRIFMELYCGTFLISLYLCLYQMRRGKSFIFEIFWSNFLESGNYLSRWESTLYYLVLYFTSNDRKRISLLDT